MELVRGRQQVIEQDMKKQRHAAVRAASLELAQTRGLAGWLLGMMQRREGPRAVKNLRVLDTLSLGGKRQLMLVACGSERFLVGTGADTVQTMIRLAAAGKQEAACL